MSSPCNLARARIYRLLAHLFQPPDAEKLSVLKGEDLPELSRSLAAVRAPRELRSDAKRLAARLARADLEQLSRDYERQFEPSGGSCKPPNETAHAPETPQEGLTRTYELADIAGFYRAFGVEVTPGTERVDHVAAELEFMHLLALKEALAEESGESERASVCRDAAAAFLRDHLGRWSAKLHAQLREEPSGEVYPAAGALLDRFVAHELESGLRSSR